MPVPLSKGLGMIGFDKFDIAYAFLWLVSAVFAVMSHYTSALTQLVWQPGQLFDANFWSDPFQVWVWAGVLLMPYLAIASLIISLLLALRRYRFLASSALILGSLCVSSTANFFGVLALVHS
jgi:hypothetical protein